MKLNMPVPTVVMVSSSHASFCSTYIASVVFICSFSCSNSSYKDSRNLWSHLGADISCDACLIFCHM